MDTKQLVQRARQTVRGAAYPPCKLFLVHTGVAVGATLLVALLQYVLNGQIQASAGLGGMQMRSVLQTARTLLSYVLTVAMPLWEVGAVFAAIRILRGERAETGTLLEGFRQFWPMLRSLFLELGVYLGAAIGCSYGASLLYSFTPMAMRTMEKLQPFLEQITTQTQLMELMQDPSFAQMLTQEMWPAVLLCVLASVCAMVFLFYRMRFVRYLVLDAHMGAFQALKTSARITGGQKWSLAKLDLHFWWYYVLQLLTALILYVPELCAITGIALPINADAAYWVFYGAYAVAQIALLSLARPQVEVSFAGAYDALKPKE